MFESQIADAFPGQVFQIPKPNQAIIGNLFVTKFPGLWTLTVGALSVNGTTLAEALAELRRQLDLLREVFV